MKIQIRSDVFETNSSSMHSLVIKKCDDYMLPEEIAETRLNKDKKIRFWREEDLEFGRHPFKVLFDFRKKLAYAIASLCNWRHSKEKTFAGIERVVMEIVPGCEGIELPCHHWYGDEEPKIYYGSVDEDILSPFLKKRGISLKEFLTNKKYIVIVDGDEYCIWENMKEEGLINRGAIEAEFGSYELIYRKDGEDEKTN